LGALAAPPAGGVLTENRELLGWRVPRAGALGLLLVTYAAACSFHAGGLWRVRGMIAGVALPAAGAGALVLLLRALQPEVGRDVLVWVGVLPVLGFLVFEPVRVAVAQGAYRRAGALLERVAHLRTDDFGIYVANLRAWPEIRRVEVIGREELAAHGYDQVHRHFEAERGPAERAALRARLVAAPAGGPTRAAEQLLDLMQRRGCDFVLPLGDGAVMTVAVDGFLDRGAFRLALHPVGELSRLVRQVRPGAGGGA
jgi:hypothetical protein